MNINEIDNKINALIKLREIVSKEPNNIYEIVFISYICNRRVLLVANDLKEKGLRYVNGDINRYYTSTDITNILESEEAKREVRQDIYDLAIKIKIHRRFSYDYI